MLLWIVLALLTGAVLLVLLRPLTRPAEAQIGRGDYDLKIYRDQLLELDRDGERGVLNPSEAAALKTEIERRLLATARQRPQTSEEATTIVSRPSIVAIGAIMLAVPAVALLVYLDLGAPEVADAPLAARGAERDLLAMNGSLDMDKARTALEARLTADPESLEGWLLLGRTDTVLERWNDAKAAFAKALTLSNRSATVLQDYGEALVSEAQGTVTDEAAALFKEAVSKNDAAYEARYDLALATAQHGDVAGAIVGWRALERDAPANAPWLPTLKESIRNLEEQAPGGPVTAAAAPPDIAPAGDTPPADAPMANAPMAGAIMKLPPAERLDAIRGMVAGLAEKLKTNPDDLAGWTRLARSYLVLGEPEKSAAAYANAIRLSPKDPDLVLGRAQALRGALADTTAADGAPALDPPTIDAYRQVAALEPDQPEALWYLGLAAKQRGDTDEARRDWRKLLDKLGPASTSTASVEQALAKLPQ